MLNLKIERVCSNCGKGMKLVRKWKPKKLLQIFCIYNSAWGMEEKFICSCGNTIHRPFNTQDHLQITTRELKKHYKQKFKGK